MILIMLAAFLYMIVDRGSNGNTTWKAEDLVRQLCTDAQRRIGKGGAEEIKAHPFFEGVDWENIRSQKAPIDPKVKGAGVKGAGVKLRREARRELVLLCFYVFHVG